MRFKNVLLRRARGTGVARMFAAHLLFACFLSIALDTVTVHVARRVQMLLLVLARKLGFAYFA